MYRFIKAFALFFTVTAICMVVIEIVRGTPASELTAQVSSQGLSTLAIVAICGVAHTILEIKWVRRLLNLD